MRQTGLAFLFCALLALAQSAIAAEPKPAKAGGGQYLDMAPVALPVISHGRLVNYVFVTLRLNLNPGADAVKMREKEPFFRDALVRLAARTPLNPPGDLIHADEGLIRADMLSAAGRLLGPGVVTSVIVMHQAAQHIVGLQAPRKTGFQEP